MKTKYYLLIAIMLLLFHNRTYCQYDTISIELLRGGSILDDNFDFKPAIINTSPKETILGYEWDSIYKDEPKETIDSIKKCLQELDLAAAHLTIKIIIDECGKYFYRLNHKTVRRTLEQKLNIQYEKIPFSFEHWQKILRPILDSNSRSITKSISNQIWDEDIYFTINPNYSPNFTYSDFDGASPYTEQIASLKGEYDSNYHIKVNGLPILINNIQNIEDKWTRWLLWMQLSEKLFHLRANDYLPAITNEIYSIVFNSTSKDGYWNASYMLYCAKLLSSFGSYENGQLIYPFLKYAQIELSFDNKESIYYQKSEIIRSQFWKALPGIDAKESAWQIALNEYKNHYNNSDTLDFKFITLLSDVLHEYIREFDYTNYQVSEQVKLNLCCYILTSIKLNEKLSKRNFDESGRYFYMMIQNLANYYLLEKDYVKYREFCFYQLRWLISSKDPIFRLRIPNTIVAIAQSYHFSGQNDVRDKWLGLLINNLDYLNNPLLRLPHDTSLWTPQHYTQISKAIKKYGKALFVFQSNYYTHYKSQQFGRFLSLRTAQFEADKQNWKDAYFLARVADSLKFEPNVGYYANMVGNGQEAYFQTKGKRLQDSLFLLRNNILAANHKLANLNYENEILQKGNKNLSDEIIQQREKIIILNSSIDSLKEADSLLRVVNNELQEDIAEKNAIIYHQDTAIANRAIIIDKLNTNINSLLKTLATGKVFLILIGVFCIILIVGSYYAFKQRNKAKEAKAKAEILSYTMYQMGHMAPLCINNINERFDNYLVTPIKNTLSDLSNLLREFYEYSQIEITYEQEYNLACNYVDLAFQTPNGELPSDKIEANWSEFSELKLPTYILFNTIQNAFKHGRIWSDTKNSSRVTTHIEEKEGKYIATITNPILGKEKKVEKGTGMKYINAILSYWNSKKTGNFNYSISNGVFNFIFVFHSKK